MMIIVMMMSVMIRYRQLRYIHVINDLKSIILAAFRFPLSGTCFHLKSVKCNLKTHLLTSVSTPPTDPSNRTAHVYVIYVTTPPPTPPLHTTY